MSEELKDKADAFCGSRGIVCPNAWMVALMAEFAAQVCEQREKELVSLNRDLAMELHAILEKRERERIPENEMMHLLRRVNREFEQELLERRAESKTLTERAEAAELALHNEIVRWQKRIYDVCRKVYAEVDGAGCDSGDELDFSIDEIEQTFAHLQNALQAKEQEVTKLFKEVSLLNGQLAQAEARELARESELAQARQQAIADHIEVLEDVMEDVAWLERQRWGKKDDAIQGKLRGMLARVGAAIGRSLTPPPALTKEK